MFPITSFTASLGHDGNIDIFGLALSPQAQPGQGVPVFRIRQKKAGGDWRPWAHAGKPGNGAVGVRSITGIEGHGHVLAKGGAGHLWFNERRPDDSFSGCQLAPAGRPDGGPADEPGLMTQIIRFSCARGRDGRAERRLRCAGRVGPPDRAWPGAAALRAVLPGGAAWPW